MKFMKNVYGKEREREKLEKESSVNEVLLCYFTAEKMAELES